MCHYEPSEVEKKVFKELCKHLVQFIQSLEKAGDINKCTIQDAHELIDHLYNPNLCKEKKNDC